MNEPRSVREGEAPAEPQRGNILGSVSDSAGASPSHRQDHRAGSDLPFFTAMGSLSGGYLLLIVALLVADIAYTSPRHFLQALGKPEIQSAIQLTLLSCTVSALMSIWVATPLGYLLSRFHFRGRGLIDLILDVPVVLPPLVLGLSLLILFHIPIAGTNLETLVQERLGVRVTYQPIAVVLAQFTVACAFSVQTMRVAFDQIDPRAEMVALTLGCRRSQAFLQVVLPQAWRGVITAFTVAWARSLGEFGPILVFAGTTRMKTEVLSTSVYIELSTGDLEAAVAVSLLMVLAAMVVLGTVRLLRMKGTP